MTSVHCDIHGRHRADTPAASGYCSGVLTTFRIDVSYSTHAALQDGVTVLGVRRVTVLARNGVDAALVAAQMVACHDLMPTATRIRP